MKLLTLTLSVLFLVSGCGYEKKDTNVIPMSQPQDIYKYKVSDKYLDCIKTGQGISCNWEKYNKNINQPDQ